MDINYKYSEVHKEYIPTLYPGDKDDDWEIPEDISTDHHRLNSIIESKYSREFLKICAFYNKMFPSLKGTDWSNTTYNVPAFTTMDQERSDTGTGTNYNYLKQIVDQITSRLGTITFVPNLISEDQSYEYIVYRDEVERILRKYIKDDNFNRMSIECFHNAAVLGYSHVFIDPYTGKLVKANDYEVGMFESQFKRGKVSQMLYRDYAFPVSEVSQYLVDCDDEQKQEIIESMSSKNNVDFKMYFDCAVHKVYVTVNNKTLPEREYDFDYVLMATFQWDVGFTNVLTTSIFDLLYPIQREVNKVAAKIQQLIRMYKGAVPVFNNDVDLAMKSITNGAGEALYVDSTRPIDSLMTVINPTPLDSQLDAQIQSYKTTMYELAGIQNASFDMENMRSAAAVVALDQTRDSVFQAQMSGMSQFIKAALRLYVQFFAKYPAYAGDRKSVDWESINTLLENSYIELQPVHVNDPLSDEEKAKAEPTDYNALAIARATLDVIKGKETFDTIPYYLDKSVMATSVAGVLIKFEALGIYVPDSIHAFLIAAFIDDIAKGVVNLGE